MLRLILWLITIYFAFRVIKILFSLYQRPKQREDIVQPFSNIEEADFEDITPKDDTSDSSKDKQKP
jgi:hypothetical protein